MFCLHRSYPTHRATAHDIIRTGSQLLLLRFSAVSASPLITPSAMSPGLLRRRAVLKLLHVPTQQIQPVGPIKTCSAKPNARPGSPTRQYTYNTACPFSRRTSTTPSAHVHALDKGRNNAAVLDSVCVLQVTKDLSARGRWGGVNPGRLTTQVGGLRYNSG